MPNIDSSIWTDCTNKTFSVILQLFMISLQRRSMRLGGYTWRYPKKHETSIRQWSYFAHLHFVIPDVFQFIIGYLDGVSLAKLARRFGMNYSTTSVDWANFVREPMKMWVNEEIPNFKITGIVEIDESLFGRRMKYHRGKFPFCK